MEHKVMPSTHQRTQYEQGDHHIHDSHKGHGVDHSGHEIVFRNAQLRRLRRAIKS